MAVPDFQSLMLPLLKLAGDGQQHTLAEAVERLAQEFQLSGDDRTHLLRSGQTRLYNRVGWTTTYLKKAGLLRAVGPGRYQLTERGREVLASGPTAIDVAFLESRFPEMSEFRKARSRGEVAGEEPPAAFNTADGTWNQRVGVEERVRETLELSIPNEVIRRAAQHLLALAIDNADEAARHCFADGRHRAWGDRPARPAAALRLGRHEGARSPRLALRGLPGGDARLLAHVQRQRRPCSRSGKTRPPSDDIGHRWPATSHVALRRDAGCRSRRQRRCNAKDHDRVPPALRDKGRAVDEKYEDAAERNLDRAHAISDYRFPTVDIRKTAATQDEEVTEEERRRDLRPYQQPGNAPRASRLRPDAAFCVPRIEERARAMSQGTVVGIDPQQLLRAVCGVAFGRARMSAVYRYLRGVDPTTGEADTARRLKLLGQLDDAAKECMEPTPWRDYLLRVKHAGFVCQALIASKNAIVNAYAFYIRGRKAGVPKSKLDEMIARWVFGTLLTARYSGSSETIFEEDLARVARLGADDADGFVRALDDAMAETITGDYWRHPLVSALETQKARAPAALAFRAAQVVLGTRALFSDQLLHNLLDPPAQGARAASEAHHLFPEAWLHARGIQERRRVNQVANLADVDWHENSLIGGRGPAEYVPRLRQKLAIDDHRWGRLCSEHALPLGWESMEYEEFLRERRRRMGDIIRVAFRQLGGEADAPPLTPPWFLPGAETVWQRIVETERALRRVAREVYAASFGEAAARRIEEALPERERDSLARALRARPAGSEPLSIVDYLYLGQLPPSSTWRKSRSRTSSSGSVSSSSRTSA